MATQRLVLLLLVLITCGCFILWLQKNAGEKKSERAFQLLAIGFQKANEAEAGKNDALIDLLVSRHSENKRRVDPYLQDAREAWVNLKEFIRWLEGLREEIDKDGAETVLVKKGKAKQLLAGIDSFRIEQLSLPKLWLFSADSLRILQKIMLRAGGPLDASVFEGISDAAAIALLNKLEGDAIHVTGMVLERLYNHTDASSTGCSFPSARVIAANSYLKTGEEYRADIFVAEPIAYDSMKIYIGTFDKSTVPDINNLPWIVNNIPLKPGYDSLEVKSGLGMYISKASLPGKKQVDGAVKVKKPDGSGFQYFPFYLRWEVTRPCP